ncbi:hypothetical protein KEJ37_00860 [Candidatus Bathyarchaeota archaeon]|nr:hypothetical protein [Candidatus Bathyarchaeota archaeon]
MNVRIEVKAASTLVILFLMIISAIVGGIISYAFTIAYYTKKPQGTTLTITDVYISKENTNLFTISVLNPSYSPTDATISRIAISLERETQLYDVIETEPSIGNGIVVPIGESKNITCIKIKKDNANVTLGELIGSYDFAGKNIIVHVFSQDSAAANIRARVPYVKLDIAEKFDSKFSFKTFNITLTNSPQSEVNITLSDMLIGGVDAQANGTIRGTVIPKGEHVCFMFNGSWHGVAKTSIIVYTEQGYVFRKEIELRNVYVAIQNVSFDIENRDYFNVTIFNFAESAHYANLTMIKCRLDNGTYIPEKLCDPPVGIAPNSTVTIRYDWNWAKYRGRSITIVAYFLQDFETTSYTGITPPPIIVKVLNETSVFNLQDKEHFNITIQNHASSLEAIKITQIKIKRTGQLLNGTTEVNPQLPCGPIAPGESKTLKCTFDWVNYIKNYDDRNLTLSINVTTNTAPLISHSFDFIFILPVAELNITSVELAEVGEMKYLNITIKSKNYSLWNLTLAKIIVTVQNLTVPLEYVFPKNQALISVGSEVVLLCPFDWQKYSGKDLTVTVVSDEHVGASRVYHIP